MDVADANVASAVDRAYREESGRVVATLIRLLGGDFAAAEEVVQEAFATALERWPREGVPQVPRAWLIGVAKHKAVDRLRRGKLHQERVARIAEVEETLSPPPDGTEWDGVPDDQLRLLFTCCHPALALEAQVALALRTLCGLTTEEVARAFLVPTATMAQRLVRAQRKIRDARIPYALPPADQLDARVGAVLHVIYLAFSEGYAATVGDALVRIDLCEQAIRLGRLAHRLLPMDPEVAALLALMLLHDARRAARVSPDGGLVLLDHQDRTRWDRARIAEGSQLLDTALARGARGAFAIQAAIAALHAEAARPEDTDWRQISHLYDALYAQQPSPVVALNRAVAIAMAEGPERGLAQIDDLERGGRLADYHLLPAARADLLRRLGRTREAIAEYRRAIALAQVGPERAFLEGRLRELTSGS